MKTSSEERVARQPNEVGVWLRKNDACDEARKWAEQYKTLSEAWAHCQNPDWMLWVLDKKIPATDVRYRLFACWSVRNTPLADGRKVWDLLTDERSRNAVVVAEKFCKGEAFQEELAAAWDAAWGAARTAAAGAARTAAWAAARTAAAGAARTAAGAARTAAAGAARTATRDAAWDAARDAAWAAQCNGIRLIFGNPFDSQESVATPDATNTEKVVTA